MMNDFRSRNGARHLLIGFFLVVGANASNLLAQSDNAALPAGSSAPGKMSGDDFLKMTSGLRGHERERAIRDAFKDGHFPEFLLHFKPVTVTKGSTQITFMVAPDYLSVGHNDEFVRMPMGLDTSISIAKQFDCILPTSKMVDLIYQQSTLKIEAYFLPPGPAMSSNSYYARHHNWIEDQLLDNYYQNHLVAGHKKDVVLSKRLLALPDRLAIYGWQRLRDRRPIQGLNTWHGKRYADYSHGTRLISRYAFVNNEKRDLYEILEDPELAHLLSYEGPIRVSRLMNPGSHSEIVTAAH